MSPCHRGVEAKAVGYCIADSLSAGYNGDGINGLFFTGANGYKIKEITTVKAIFEELTK